MTKTKPSSRQSAKKGVAVDPRDPGPLATLDEAQQAWSEVIAVMREIEHWNLPKAAKYVRSINLSGEAIALGFFALDVLRRSESKRLGEKGGRPSEKPTNFELKKRYDLYLAECGSERQARATLSKELHETTGAALRTVRGWLQGAGI